MESEFQQAWLWVGREAYGPSLARLSEHPVEWIAICLESGALIVGAFLWWRGRVSQKKRHDEAMTKHDDAMTKHDDAMAKYDEVLRENRQFKSLFLELVAESDETKKQERVKGLLVRISGSGTAHMTTDPVVLTVIKPEDQTRGWLKLCQVSLSRLLRWCRSR